MRLGSKVEVLADLFLQNIGLTTYWVGAVHQHLLHLVIRIYELLKILSYYFVHVLRNGYAFKCTDTF